MYKILLADDESIVIESLKFIINKKYGDICEIECAKSGKTVIELAETFRPDIAFMDIHMPGINGIEAMKEIRKQNDSVIFIVMTAFDKFDYARESISLGVLEYLSKPANRDVIEKTVEKAMSIIDKRREVRNKDLTVKEKLELVVPFMETGMIHTLLLNESDNESIDKYRGLLSITQDYSYMMVIEAREEFDTDNKNVAGSSIRLQEYYELIKESIKDEVNCIVGPVMTNKIIVLVPYDKKQMAYAERIVLIDRFRMRLHFLEEMMNVELKIGIGNVKSFYNALDSYHEAKAALHIGVGSVLHVSDIKNVEESEVAYPEDIKGDILHAVEKGDVNKVVFEAGNFFNWCVSEGNAKLEAMKINVLDLVFMAEYVSNEKGLLHFDFNSRIDYLPFVYNCDDVTSLKSWFERKLSDAAESVAKARDEIKKSPVEKSILYIDEHYKDDISLEQMSQLFGVSPYYFSKLFKAEMQINFLDYVTNLRINKAKDLLEIGDMTIKEIGVEVGYPDPNYFTRIFKKNVGVTPTEYVKDK